MIDIIVIGILIWLLTARCILHTQYSKERQEWAGILDTIHDNWIKNTKYKETFKEEYSIFLKLSSWRISELGEKISSTKYVIIVSLVCITALTVLVALNYVHDMPSAGWMSVLLLPAPTYMLGWNKPSWISTIRWLAVLMILILLGFALVLGFIQIIPATTNGESQSGDVIGMGASIGVFAIISGLMVIVAGGTVLRLLYVDEEYRTRNRTIDVKWDDTDHSAQTAHGNSGQSTGDSANNAHEKGSGSLSNTYMELGNIRGKIEANRNGIIIDGICMVMICIIGFATALEYSPDLRVSAVISFACFLCAIIPLQYHIRNTFRSES